MSDDVDPDAYGGGVEDRAAAMKTEMEVTVDDLRKMGYGDREIYDALILVAREIRAGRDLTEFA